MIRVENTTKKMDMIFLQKKDPGSFYKNDINDRIDSGNGRSCQFGQFFITVSH